MADARRRLQNPYHSNPAFWRVMTVVRQSMRRKKVHISRGTNALGAHGCCACLCACLPTYLPNRHCPAWDNRLPASLPPCNWNVRHRFPVSSHSKTSPYHRQPDSSYPAIPSTADGPNIWGPWWATTWVPTWAGRIPMA